MKRLRVLVACEFSGIVREAFRAKGHDAYSCDLLPTEMPSPYHIQGDVLSIFNDGWDLLIAFPPCTYLSNAGARWLYKGGNIQLDRLERGMEARCFFLNFLESNIPKIAVENPTPSKIYQLPKNSQVIQPFEYGHPFSKRTLLWLKGLPALKPTSIIDKYEPLVTTKNNPRSWQKVKDRSRTFPGIAAAMADQWGSLS